MTDFIKPISEYFKEAVSSNEKRLNRSISLEELHQRIGLSTSYIHEIMTGKKSNPSPQSAQKLIFYSIPVDQPAFAFAILNFHYPEEFKDHNEFINIFNPDKFVTKEDEDTFINYYKFWVMCLTLCKNKTKEATLKLVGENGKKAIDELLGREYIVEDEKGCLTRTIGKTFSSNFDLDFKAVMHCMFFVRNRSKKAGGLEELQTIRGSLNPEGQKLVVKELKSLRKKIVKIYTNDKFKYGNERATFLNITSGFFDNPEFEEDKK